MLAVPNSPLTLCDALHQLCIATWHEMKAGDDCRQPLDEESITSYNLMRLASAVSTVIVEKHTRGREARSGADWEWWVGRPGGYIGFHIQAKRLDPVYATYKALYRTQATALDQVDKLIRASESGPSRTYPLYAFYNYWRSSLYHPRDPGCPQVFYDQALMGWTVMSAYVLRSRLRAKPTNWIKHLEPYMVPMRCLYCCRGECSGQSTDIRDGSFAEIVAERVQALWPVSDEHKARIHSTAPAYVERMYKGETAEQGWGYFGRKFVPEQRKIPRGLSRVVLLRDIR